MTPKQRAAYLIVKYMSKVVSKQVAKECALVTVDELIEHCSDANQLYWMEVKQEIEKA